MRISDFIAAAAFLVAIIGAFLIHRRSKSAGGPPSLNTSVKITYGPDKKKGRKASSEENPPFYKGTFTVNEGTVSLEAAHFLIRRKSDGDFVEFHSFWAEFDPPRERPTIERGHLIHAKPANADRFKESLVEAEAVLVEFKDTSGRIFRSPEIAVRQVSA